MPVCTTGFLCLGSLSEVSPQQPLVGVAKARHERIQVQTLEITTRGDDDWAGFGHLTRLISVGHECNVVADPSLR